MGTIEVPVRLAEVLKKKDDLQAGVLGALANYSRFLRSSTLPFFPEYTDHGPEHIARVLATCDALVPDAALGAVTAQDVATLSLAVLLHDVAMHLTEDGFRRLARGETTLVPQTAFGDRPWPELWEEFRSEATRFSGAQNRQLFGEPEPVEPPKLDALHWHDKQKLLAGEFIRRHHTRLAHQIALAGFPGAKQEELKFDEGLLSKNVIGFAGLVARSHGLDLRRSVDHLERMDKARVERFGIHATYLMCLLRVADYLQLESDRAPELRLRFQSLRSPVSVREWSKHHAAVEVKRHDDDPEAIDVYVQPPTVEVYLAVRELVDSIQAEIDASWSVLGEVYGSLAHKKLDVLELTVRRLRTNLDEPNLAENLAFVPARLRFQASDAELLKLLVEPLYGGRRDLAVRELLQNAIDAVNELDAYCARRGKDKAELPLPIQKADIVIDEERTRNGSIFVISDAGIGMQFETVRDYFLRVGSSFRNSPNWSKEFASGPHAVYRSGRFGIGALSAFLLGPEIEVSTRHVSQERGVEFRARLDSDPIEMRLCERPIGTTIRIPLSKTQSHVGFPWNPCYELTKPTILQAGVQQRHERGEHYPGPSDPIPPKWQRLPSVDDPIVLWWRGGGFVNRVTCNGIQVEHGDQPRRELWHDQQGLVVECPFLHFFDRSGKVPLNLARTEFLLDQFAQKDELRDDAFRDLLGFVLVNTPERPARDAGWQMKPSRHVRTLVGKLNFPSLSPFRSSPWVITERGVCLLDAPLLEELGISSLVVLPAKADPAPYVDGTTGVVALERSVSLEDLPGLIQPVGGFASPPGGLNVVGSQAAVSKSFNDNQFAGATALFSDCRRVWDSLTIAILSRGTTDDDDMPLRRQATELSVSHDHPFLAVQWKLGPPDLGWYKPSPLVELWREHIPTLVVPYARNERRRALASAYRALAHYVEAWEALERESEGPAGS